MQQKKTYELTGLFVVIGLLCLGGIIFKYVGSKYTQNESDLVIMYFEESIRGLSVGSSVVMQGVEVGKVERIKLLADLNKGTFKTPVYISLNGNKTVQAKYSKTQTDREILQNLIDKGLRARLITANYLTGQLMIELLMDPKVEAVMRGTGKYMEIPTEYSSFAMLSKDLEDIPLRDSLSRLGSILNDLEENLPTILENISQITVKMDDLLARKNGETTKTLQNFNDTLEEIGKASRSIKNLTDYLERHPEALIQGKEK